MKDAADGIRHPDFPQAGVGVMRHTDYRTLLDRGRKAGLKTADLYSALTARRPEAGDHYIGETDGNGIVPGFDQHGQSVFRPAGNQ